MGSSNETILKTLLYSDIFDYPLSKEEIWKFLISKNKENKQDFLKYLSHKNPLINYKKNFYFIKGREEVIKKRQEKEIHSLKKIKFAKKIIQKLSLIPTVYFIGISGALAMKNSEENDDIDLFVISSRNSVWTTRLIMVMMLIFLRVYRTKKEKKVANKICLNMIIDDSALTFSKERNDLYTAHEIGQMLPIFNKNKTYERFIASNAWIKNFLPNVFIQRQRIPLVLNVWRINLAVNYLLGILRIEFLARTIQFWYMKKHITTETTLNNFLAFHPFDYKTHVMRNYEKKLKNIFVVVNTRGY
jgi:hypothetical protein